MICSSGMVSSPCCAAGRSCGASNALVSISVRSAHFCMGHSVLLEAAAAPLGWEQRLGSSVMAIDRVMCYWLLTGSCAAGTE